MDVFSRKVIFNNDNDNDDDDDDDDDDKCVGQNSNDNAENTKLIFDNSNFLLNVTLIIY